MPTFFLGPRPVLSPSGYFAPVACSAASAMVVPLPGCGWPGSADRAVTTMGASGTSPLPAGSHTPVCWCEGVPVGALACCLLGAGCLLAVSTPSGLCRRTEPVLLPDWLLPDSQGRDPRTPDLLRADAPRVRNAPNSQGGGPQHPRYHLVTLQWSGIVLPCCSKQPGMGTPGP